MKSKISAMNEALFSSREFSSIGTVGTIKLLRGRAARLFNFIGRTLSYTSLRAYGSFILSFGLMSLFLNLGEYYFMENIEVSPSTIIFCVVLALISVPLLLFDRPMCIAFQDFSLTNRLFFEFFAIKRMHRSVEGVSIIPLIALLVGFVPAIIGFFTSVFTVALVMFLAIIVIVAFTSPEFPMILTLLSLPYIPILPYSEIVISCMSLIAFLSYLLKVLVGKRVFNFDIYSVIIVLTMGVVFISGAFGEGSNSLQNSLVFVSLMLGYFTASNIIVNRRLADSAMKSIIVSAIPIALIAIVEFVIELPSTAYNPPSYSTPGTSALFSTPTALAAFMLVCAVLTLTFAIERRANRKKIFYFIVFFIELAILGLVMRPEAWVAAAVAAVAYPIFKSRKIPLDVLLVLIIVPYLVFLIPSEITDAVSDYFGLSVSYSDKLNYFFDAVHVFFDNVWFGIGKGEGAYALASGSLKGGIFNSVIGIGVEFGIFALLLIGIMIVLRLRQLSYYRPYMRTSLVKVTAEMTPITLLALLALGAFDYILSDVSVFYLFWTVFAISTASLRTAKKEYDDLLGYYSDSRSTRSSALDVGINK